MNRRRNRGFTLIEVLVALAILGLSFAVLFRAMSTGLRNEQAAESATTRVLAGRSVLERVGVEIPLEPGTLEGTLAHGGSWVLTLTPLHRDAASMTASLFRAELTVTGDDGGLLHLTTIKLGR